MAKEEIVEGLRVAVSKGEPLRKAMMSFFNAGFNKRDIEEAAKALATSTLQQRAGQVIQPTTQLAQPQIPIQPQVQAQPAPIPQRLIPIQPPQFRQLPQMPVQAVQMVSDYGKKPRPASFIITLILIFFLLFLLGVLASVFFFKEELTRFFSGGSWWSFLY